MSEIPKIPPELRRVQPTDEIPMPSDSQAVTAEREPGDVEPDDDERAGDD